MVESYRFLLQYALGLSSISLKRCHVNGTYVAKAYLNKPCANMIYWIWSHHFLNSLLDFVSNLDIPRNRELERR